MRYAFFENRRNEFLLVARILMVILFVWSGWGKLTNFSGAVGAMAGAGLPIPTVAAIVAIAIEFFAGIAVAIGFLTRPLALLMAVFTLAAAFIAHHYWTMTGPEHIGNMINFYKNISIVGGFLFLCITGAGRYSIDRE
ncbi:MAG TPA: DoxX family protein [Oleiagrimonas sp.]|nr:DoxX family protein [Oleiagrimonas sp.]